LTETSRKLRSWRQAHPKTDLAAGLVPFLGTALAVQDAIHEPSLGNAAALVPYGNLLKKAKALRSITTYHGSKKGPWKDLIPDMSRPKAWGSIEGPGFYTAKDPVHAAAWASKTPINRWEMTKLDDLKYMKRRGLNALKKPETTVYPVEIPDEQFSRYLNLSDRDSLLSALEKGGFDPDEVKRYYGTRSGIQGHDSYQDLLPYKLGNDEWGETLPKIHEALKQQGIPGLHRPSVDRILTYDPSTVKILPPK